MEELEVEEEDEVEEGEEGDKVEEGTWATAVARMTRIWCSSWLSHFLILRKTGPLLLGARMMQVAARMMAVVARMVQVVARVATSRGRCRCWSR